MNKFVKEFALYYANIKMHIFHIINKDANYHAYSTFKKTNLNVIKHFQSTFQVAGLLSH